MLNWKKMVEISTSYAKLIRTVADRI